MARAARCLRLLAAASGRSTSSAQHRRQLTGITQADELAGQIRPIERSAATVLFFVGACSPSSVTAGLSENPRSRATLSPQTHVPRSGFALRPKGTGSATKSGVVLNGEDGGNVQLYAVVTPLLNYTGKSVFRRTPPCHSRSRLGSPATHHGKVAPSRATIRPRFTTVRRPGRCADRSREFAALLVDGADGSLILLGDDEHRWSMSTHPAAGNARGAVARGEAAAPCTKVWSSHVVRATSAKKEPSRRSDAGDYELRDASVTHSQISTLR